ncbi:MAG: hypothetical protein D3919_12440 [Candidatus Electrothrix sp. AW5]|nr:hypothetical protein [Candidatus Electrothrix gigas]
MTLQWAEKKLGDIAKISYGYTAKANQAKIGPRFLRITDIKPHGVDWNTVPFCQIDDKQHKKHRLQSGDIVFARTGATTGKSYLITNPPNAVCASYLIKLSIDDTTISPNFLSRFFQTNQYWKIINGQISGSTQGGFNARKLSELKISFPSLAEQKRIVAILDEAFAGIDQAIANTEKNLVNAREVFESYLNAIFTQKHEDETTIKLAKLCHKITVGHVGSMASKYIPKGIPFLRSQNVQPFKVTLNNIRYIDEDFHSSLQKSSLNPGDVVIVRSGYPGTAAVVPNSLTKANCSDLVIAKPKETLLPQYLVLFLNSKYGKDIVNANSVGAAQKHFNVTAAKNVLMPMVPIDKQEELVNRAGVFRKETQHLESIYQKKLNALAELKQSILHKAFTGELTHSPEQELAEVC